MKERHLKKFAVKELPCRVTLLRRQQPIECPLLITQLLSHCSPVSLLEAYCSGIMTYCFLLFGEKKAIVYKLSLVLLT